MTEPLVSFVVPVYNGENYLARCLDSILTQHYKNFEIIIVNDGSSDGSQEIISDYASSDSRVRAYFQKNSGVSVARNNGLSKASGEWITFVDCDDTISSGFLSELLAFSQESDLIVSGYTEVFTDKSIDFPIVNEVSRPDTNSYLANNIYYCQVRAPWCKLFRSKWLKSNIEFNPELHFGEDTLFNLDYLALKPRITQSPYVGYYWFRDHEESLTSNASLERWAKFLEGYLRALKNLWLSGGVERHVIHENVLDKLRIVFFDLLNEPLEYKYFKKIMSEGEFLGIPSSKGSGMQLSRLGYPLFLVGYLGRGKICYLGVLALRKLRKQVVSLRSA